ncbi:MAG TPA: hypothetical protein VE645_19190 [Pseudonocardiaceae bacterium]|jgi:hypothetical protein|nr:hypothetical protein [Pseudonocardiaceae bacterium]
MTDVVLSHTLTAGTPENVAHVQQNFEDLRDGINGGLDGDNLTMAAGQALGLNATGTVRRGASVVATEESTSSTSYTLLATPDRVSNVVLPTNGRLYIGYQAMWKESVVLAGKAAIFIGPTQLKVASSSAAAPAVQEAENGGGGSANIYKPLASGGPGLSSSGDTATVYTGDVTTGQILGHGGTNPVYGECIVFAAAGTYTISVQFKTSSGTVTVKERHLWVVAKGPT